LGAIRMSVLISCITREVIHAETAQWMCEQPYPVDIVKGPYTIEHQRNVQAERFLATSHDYLFIVDFDVIPVPGTIETLLGMTEEDSYSIHVAPCMAVDESNRPHPMAYNDATKSGSTIVVPENPFVPVTYARQGTIDVDMTGMSGALLPRSLFDVRQKDRTHIMELAGTKLDDEAPIFGMVSRPWFHMEHDQEGHLRGTEDIWFWRKVQAAGYGIKAHLYLTADHIKLWRLGLL